MASRSIAVAVPQEQTPHPDPVPIPNPAPKRKRRHVRSQRGSIVRRGRSWIAVFRTREGKQKWQTFHSKAEATKHLTDVLKLIQEDKYTDAQPELFSVYVERWLKRRAETVKPNTWNTYNTAFKKWLLPAFGDEEMRDITREQVRALAYRMIQAHHLSGKSIQIILMVLSDLFDSAIDDKVAQTNPAHRLNVDLPDDSKERHVPEPEEVSATFAALDAHPTVQVFLAAAAMTGLRKGELLGLFWDDIDWRRGTIRVERSLTRANRERSKSFRNIEWVNSTTLAVVPPKSKTSRRTVNMPAQLEDLLKQLRALTRNDSRFVFQQDETGAPLDPDLIYDPLHEAQARAGVKPFGFHGVRHLYASTLQEAGASPAHTRDRMGHSSITMTDRYTHDVADGRAYADAVARVFPFGVSKLLAERTSAR
jgi:integrase